MKSIRWVLSLFLVAVISVGSDLLLSGSANAATTVPGCDVPPAQTYLRQFGDQRLYFPVTGGNAESAAGWTLRGGAAVTSENEPWRVLSAQHSHSIRLIAGSSASTAPMCVPFVDDLRMFIRRPGVSGAVVRIHLETIGSVDPRAADYGRVKAAFDYYVSGSGAGWALTPGLAIPDGRGADGSQNLRITLAPLGVPAQWRVDDILMDPWKIH